VFEDIEVRLVVDGGDEEENEISRMSHKLNGKVHDATNLSYQTGVEPYRV